MRLGGPGSSSGPVPPKPVQAGGPKFLFGAMGPLGIKHAAEWADGWMPVDVLMPDVGEGIAQFRQAVRDNGRDPDQIDITMVAMGELSVDLLKRYRDMGISRVNIGVGMENWNKPEIVMPMISKFSKIIPQL